MSSSQRKVPESGLAVDRLEFYREAVTGEFNDNPEYMLFSDSVSDLNIEPGLDIERREALGRPDASGYDRGGEEGEIELIYHLQRPWVDAQDDPLDAVTDALFRDDDHRIINTHSIRIMEERHSSEPGDPENTSGSRVYTIVEGGHPELEEAEMDPEDGGPILINMNYFCEKIRDYEIFQPPGDEALSVVSTEASDDTQTLSLEADDGTLEEVNLTGDTPVTTTETAWSSLRGMELDEETQGDVVISLETTDVEIARIRGSLYYGRGGEPLEGDLGVPVIDQGSLGDPINDPYIYFFGADVTRDGETLPYDVNRMSLMSENNYEPFPRIDSTRSRWTEGNRDLMLETDVIGWGASADYYDEALGMVEADMKINLSSFEIDLFDVMVVEPGEKERGPEDTAIEYGVTFSPTGDPAIALTQN